MLQEVLKRKRGAPRASVGRPMILTDASVPASAMGHGLPCIIRDDALQPVERPKKWRI